MSFAFQIQVEYQIYTLCQSGHYLTISCIINNASGHYFLNTGKMKHIIYFTQRRKTQRKPLHTVEPKINNKATNGTLVWHWILPKQDVSLVET
jgi:hypothetical protein